MPRVFLTRRKNPGYALDIWTYMHLLCVHTRGKIECVFDVWSDMHLLCVCAPEEEMTDTGLLDDTGNLLPESHFIFTTLPDSSFMAESA